MFLHKWRISRHNAGCNVLHSPVMRDYTSINVVSDSHRRRRRSDAMFFPSCDQKRHFFWTNVRLLTVCLILWAQFWLKVLFCLVAPFLYSRTKNSCGPRRLTALNMHECCSEVSDTGIASVWAHSAWPLAVPWPAHHEGCWSIQFLKFALCGPSRFLLLLWLLWLFFFFLQNLSIGTT